MPWDCGHSVLVTNFTSPKLAQKPIYNFYLISLTRLTPLLRRATPNTTKNYIPKYFEKGNSPIPAKHTRQNYIPLNLIVHRVKTFAPGKLCLCRLLGAWSISDAVQCTTFQVQKFLNGEASNLGGYSFAVGMLHGLLHAQRDNFPFQKKNKTKKKTRKTLQIFSGPQITLMNTIFFYFI